MSLDYKVYSGFCPDEKCQSKLYFPAHKRVIECSNCGQSHSQVDLHNIIEVTDGEEAFTEVLKSIVWDAKLPKKGSDSIKVQGLSNYHCKLLSPLFTRYGMDKAGNPKLLLELGHGETADCGRLLSHRAFLISPEHINITGYGKDQSGSVEYLNGLLDIIKEYHEGEERLIPVHADGDGHCLVHALSRATTGREIFWHALRDNLVHHLEKNLQTYQIMFQDFIDKNDWRMIIEEADPYHTSPEGFNIGLGNIHIFALANVLKRPIVLLDSLEGMKNVADYTAIFVPALVEPSQCRENLPLCVAWSGASHNHFVPLVGVAGRSLPAIPSSLLPNIWGIDTNQGARYLTFNEDGSLTVAGGKPLQTGYLLRLVSAMEKIFLESHSITAKLVSDMHFYVYKRVGFVGLHPDVAIERTKHASQNNKIFQCLVCNALSLCNVDDDGLKPGGYLFEVMRSTHGKPRENVTYNFPMAELLCRYDALKDCLVPYQFPCCWCGVKRLRRVNNLGNVMFENGDPTPTSTEVPGQCCGFKHFWEGKEYENIPRQFMLRLTIQEKTIEEKVTWFFGEVDSSLNSDKTKIAKDIAEKYCSIDEPNFHAITNGILESLETNLSQYGLNDGIFPADQSSSNEASSFLKTSRNKTKIQQNKTKLGSTSTKLCENSPKIFHLDEPSLTVKIKADTKSGKVADVDSQQKTTGHTDDGTIKIRISTSDGRQETLAIDSDMDYTDLQNTVQKYFGVSLSRQILKLGFPPKLLEPVKGKVPLGLRNGDRVTVEIKRENKTSETDNNEMPSIPRRRGLLRDAIKTDARDDTQDQDTLHTFVHLLQSTKNQQSPRYTTMTNASIDTALSAVSKMAEMTGKESVWDYSVNHPELFQLGGAFYEQFGRDIGLFHEKHCKLPLLPGHVFRYNQITDKIELCKEPDGHYAVGPGIVRTIEIIEKRRSEASNAEEQMDSQDDITGASVLQDENHPSLNETEAMQVDPETMRPQPDETANDSTSSGSQESKMGPGYTTLGPQPTEISLEEAETERNKLLQMLKSKKQNEE
ncbi:deubiquitinating protein VCPIP1-like [Styela clava]